MKKYVFALLSIGFIIWGCNKDDDDDNNDNSGDKEKIQLITSATWKYDTAAIADNNGNPVSALPSGIINACDKDNTITFKSDSTGVLNEGTTKCNSNDPQTTNFKWWFKENGTVLYTPDDIFGSPSFTGDFKVIELTSTRLRVTKQVTVAPYPTTNVALYLKH
jgi:hypothetical protein